MSFLRGASTSQPNYTGVPIQTAVYTLPIAVLWGTGMVGSNLIWYSDFTKSNASSSGGKGGVLGKSGNTAYSAAIMMAMCEGPVEFVKIAKDGVSWESLSQTGFGLIGGAVPQTAWSFLTSKHPSQALTYPGIAMLVNEQFQMGSSPQMPSQQVVLQGPLAGTAAWASAGEVQSADLGLVIQDLLTNARYGVQDFPSSAINLTTLLSTSAATTTGDNSLQTWCRAMGWGFNPKVDSIETSLTVLKRWMDASYCDIVWSGTALKFIPYGDTEIYGNSVTYLPNLTPIYSLDDDDFVTSSNSDPVKITRVDPATVPNIVRVEVINNDGYYERYPCEARDQAAIEAVGERPGSSVSANEIIGPPQGTQLANLILQKGLATRNTYEFTLDFSRCLLEPMDLIEITDINLGLSQTVVRIIAIEEDGKGNLKVTAEEFPQGIATGVLYGSQGTTYFINNTANVPASVNTPVIFEPPAALTTDGGNEVWIALSGGTSGVADPTWGGAFVYVSTDNVNYSLTAQVVAPARQGVLTATLGAYSGPAGGFDSVNTLTVNLAESAGELISTTALNASLGQTMCYVDGELLGFTTATLVSGYTYTLSGLYRNMLNTGSGSHAPGALFARLDNSIYIDPLQPQYIGVPLWFKCCSYNIWGQGVQSLASATAYTYTVAGATAGILNATMTANTGLEIAAGFY